MCVCVWGGGGGGGGRRGGLLELLNPTVIQLNITYKHFRERERDHLNSE